MRTKLATTAFEMPLYGISFPLSACQESSTVFRNTEKLSCANIVSSSKQYIKNVCFCPTGIFPVANSTLFLILMRMLFRSFSGIASCPAELVFASVLSWSAPLILGICIAAALYLFNYGTEEGEKTRCCNQNKREMLTGFASGKIRWSPEMGFTVFLTLCCIILLLLRCFLPNLFLLEKAPEKEPENMQKGKKHSLPVSGT